MADGRFVPAPAGAGASPAGNSPTGAPRADGAAHRGGGAAPGSLAGHPAPARGAVSLRALWFGLFGGAAAWSVQLLVDFPLAAHSCYPGLYPLDTPMLSGLRGVVFAVSLVALLVCIAASVVAWRAWLHTRDENQGRSGRGGEHGPGTALLETGEGRTRFMALSGVLTSSAFLILSIVHTAVVFLVHPCGI